MFAAGDQTVKTGMKQLPATRNDIIAYNPLQHGGLNTEFSDPCSQVVLRTILLTIGAKPEIMGGAVEPEPFNRVAYFALHIQAAYVPLDPHGTEKFLNLQCEMLPKAKALSLKRFSINPASRPFIQSVVYENCYRVSLRRSGQY